MQLSVLEMGVISPGGVGFDINCGARLLRTNLTEDELKPKLNQLMDALFKNIPSGVGSKGKIRLQEGQIDEVLDNGAEWAVENGYGWERDLQFIEENGKMESADSSKVSDKAKKRGVPQLGSLGSGNHFLEIQKMDKIFDHDYSKSIWNRRRSNSSSYPHRLKGMRTSNMLRLPQSYGQGS